MRFRFQFPVLLLVLALAAACSQPGSSPSPTAPGASLAAGSSSPQSATVRFGNDTVGSKFPPPSGHDQSGHGRDNLIPRTVVIDQGGTVRFEIAGPVHQVSIYKDGTTVDEVSRAGAAPKAGCGPAPFIPGTGDPQPRQSARRADLRRRSRNCVLQVRHAGTVSRDLRIHPASQRRDVRLGGSARQGVALTRSHMKKEGMKRAHHSSCEVLDRGYRVDIVPATSSHGPLCTWMASVSNDQT